MGAHWAHPFDGMGARRREQKEKSGEKKSNGRWAAQHCASNHRVSDRGLIGKKGCFRGGNEKAKLRQRGNGAGRGHEMADAAIVVLIAGHLPRQMVVPMAWAVRSVREGGRGCAVFAPVLPIAGGGGCGGAEAGDALGALSVGVETDVLRWHRAERFSPPIAAAGRGEESKPRPLDDGGCEVLRTCIGAKIGRNGQRCKSVGKKRESEWCFRSQRRCGAD